VDSHKIIECLRDVDTSWAKYASCSLRDIDTLVLTMVGIVSLLNRLFIGCHWDWMGTGASMIVCAVILFTLFNLERHVSNTNLFTGLLYELSINFARRRSRRVTWSQLLLLARSSRPPLIVVVIQSAIYLLHNVHIEIRSIQTCLWLWCRMRPSSSHSSSLLYSPTCAAASQYLHWRSLMLVTTANSSLSHIAAMIGFDPSLFLIEYLDHHRRIQRLSECCCWIISTLSIHGSSVVVVVHIRLIVVVVSSCWEGGAGDLTRPHAFFEVPVWEILDTALVGLDNFRAFGYWGHWTLHQTAHLRVWGLLSWT
jgi:hypothetical protein